MYFECVCVCVGGPNFSCSECKRVSQLNVLAYKAWMRSVLCKYIRMQRYAITCSIYSWINLFIRNEWISRRCAKNSNPFKLCWRHNNSLYACTNCMAPRTPMYFSLSLYIFVFFFSLRLSVFTEAHAYEKRMNDASWFLESTHVCA